MTEASWFLVATGVSLRSTPSYSIFAAPRRISWRSARPVPRSGKTWKARGGAQRNSRNQNRAAHAALAGITIVRLGEIVAPLRGFCCLLLATGGFAALHPRLFDLRRYAAVCRAICTTTAAERQNVNSRGWSEAQPLESKSCGPCRVAALQSPDCVRSWRRYAAFVGFYSRSGVERSATPGYDTPMGDEPR